MIYVKRLGVITVSMSILLQYHTETKIRYLILNMKMKRYLGQQGMLGLVKYFYVLKNTCQKNNLWS